MKRFKISYDLISKASSQSLMEAVDLDSLLQSHGEFDSDEEHSEDLNVRTVDEILLNHSSSSPSPPSSPSNSAHQYLSNRSNEVRVRSLPQLFGGGVIRASAKPGAALAAAAAAARSTPTPHATAIKLKMRAVIAAAAAELENSRREEVSSEQSQSTEPDDDIEKADEQVGELASKAENLIGMDGEDENHCNFPAQSEPNLVLDNTNVEEEEKDVVISEVIPDGEGNDADLLISGVEEPGDVGDLSSEPGGHSEDVSSESDEADIVEDLVLDCEIMNGDDIKLQKTPNSSIKQIDLAEEIEIGRAHV